jgi:hypothetical protein
MYSSSYPPRWNDDRCPLSARRTVQPHRPVLPVQRADRAPQRRPGAATMREILENRFWPGHSGVPRREQSLRFRESTFRFPEGPVSARLFVTGMGWRTDAARARALPSRASGFTPWCESLLGGAPPGLPPPRKLGAGPYRTGSSRFRGKGPCDGSNAGLDRASQPPSAAHSSTSPANVSTSAPGGRDFMGPPRWRATR